MGPKWIPNGLEMGPKRHNMGPKWAHMGPHGALMGPKVSVEQTLIADSPRRNFMTKTYEKVPYAEP